MNSIAILHQDLEWTEQEIQRQFVKRDIHAELFDVRETSICDLCDFEAVLNRVYASVANRNFLHNLKTLEMLKAL
ncbi:MAG: hypothetical protein KJ574_01310, partial [Nanoarchaeota archaeon]|nr:hypothetical protein [Nanoarchaeota archaeon]